MKTVFCDLIHSSHSPRSTGNMQSYQGGGWREERGRENIYFSRNASAFISKWRMLFEIKDDNLDFFPV